MSLRYNLLMLNDEQRLLLYAILRKDGVPTCVSLEA